MRANAIIDFPSAYQDTCDIFRTLNIHNAIVIINII